MSAAAARNTFDLLAALAAADSLAQFANHSVYSAAEQLDRQVSVESDSLYALSRAVCSGWRLWSRSVDAPGVGAAVGVEALSNALAESLKKLRRGTGRDSSASTQEPLKSLAAAGALAALCPAADKLTTALVRHSSLPVKQQQQKLVQGMQHFRVSSGLLNVWNSISRASNQVEMLTDADLAATTQPVARLALAVIRWQEAGDRAAVLRPALQVALDAASELAGAVEILAGQGYKFTSASCVKQLLSAVEFQQLVFVYIASSTASLHDHRNGQHKVNVTGAAEPAMQLEVPAWHQKVLQELGADWAGQSLPVSASVAVPAAQLQQHQAAVYQLHLRRGLCAASYSLTESGCTMSAAQQDRMLLPLLRMLVEISALLPHITITQYCVHVSLALVLEGSDRAANQMTPHGGTSSHISSHMTFTPHEGVSRDIPVTTAAGILGPVVNLLVPSVLHVLALDSQAASKQYLELYDLGEDDTVKIVRLALVNNISSFLGMLVMALEAKHLVNPFLHKPLTSFSILEAAIRSLAAEAIKPGNRETTVGRCSEMMMQQRATWGPLENVLPFLLAVKVTGALQIAATQGKLASTLASPPAGTEQRRWSSMVSRQLTGLLVTCLKLVEVMWSEHGVPQGDIGTYATRVLSQFISDVLSVSTHAAKVLSPIAANPVRSAVPSNASDSSGGLSACSDTTVLWAVVAGRALSLLALSLLAQLLGRLLCTTATHNMAAKAILEDPQLMQSLGSVLQQLQPRLPVPVGTFTAVAQAVEWVTHSLKTGSFYMNSTAKQLLLQQQGELCSGLALAARQAEGRPASDVPAEQQQLKQLPQLLAVFGSTVCAWLPQQQWCSNLQCHNLGMLRESAIVAGSGKICAGCRSLRYCSRECQGQDWKDQHKQACKVLRQDPVVVANT